MVMDKCTEFYPVEGGIFSAERVVVPGVLEVAVVCYSGGGGEGGRGMAGLMKSFPLEEGKDLLTMGKKQMNVAIIALYMVGLRDHVVYFKFPRNIIKHYLSRKFISFETLKYV